MRIFPGDQTSRMVRLLVAGLFALGSVWANAQTDSTTASTPNEGLPSEEAEKKGFLKSNKGIKLGVNIGPRLLPGSGGTILVQYIDQSPSRDRLDAVIDVPGVTLAFAYQAFAEGEFGRFHFQLGIDGFAGKLRAVAPFAGIGITPYRVGSMDVRVGARLSYGAGSYHLGDVVNNDLWFQIGSTRIYNDKMSMTYKDRFMALQPNIGLDKGIGDHWSLQAGLIVNLVLRHHTRVVFQGIEDATHEKTEPVEVGLKDVNLGFYREDGTQINKLPLHYTGVSITAGATYRF